MIPSPCALTLGFFDGVHLGHQALFNRIRGSGVVVTFTTHPSCFFSPQTRVPLIYPLQQKLRILKKAGIDQILALEFNEELAELSPKDFLRFLKESLTFSHLVLGKGATFGKNRNGNEKRVRTLQKELCFEAQYLDKETREGHAISSGVIRSLIRKGDLDKATTLLGRRYSLELQVDHHHHVLLDGLCLPPIGPYRVTLRFGDNAEKETIFLSPDLILPSVPPGHVEIIF